MDPLNRDGIIKSNKYHFEVLNPGGRSYSAAGKYGKLEDLVYMSIHRSKSNKTHSTLAFYIGKNIVNKHRFIDGDRISILSDLNNKIIILKRITEGGNRLCADGKRKFKITTSTSERSPKINKLTICKELSMDDPNSQEGIAFTYPI